MKNLYIEWQRLLDEREKTCQRCGPSEQEIEEAIARQEVSAINVIPGNCCSL